MNGGIKGVPATRPVGKGLPWYGAFIVTCWDWRGTWVSKVMVLASRNLSSQAPCIPKRPILPLAPVLFHTLLLPPSRHITQVPQSQVTYMEGVSRVIARVLGRK